MQMNKLLLCAGSMLVFGAGLAAAQSRPEVYAVQTASKPGCPGLALHLVVSDKVIEGFAASGDMKSMSRVIGTRNGVGHFDMTMTPVDASGPKGTISGDTTTANTTIRAVIAGSGCNDGPVSLASLTISNAQ